MPRRPKPDPQPNSTVSLVIVAAIMFGGYYVSQNGVPDFLKGGGGRPAVSAATPSSEMQTIVLPVKSFTDVEKDPVKKKLSQKLGHWYRDAASVVRTDTRLQSTEQARQWLIDVDAIAISGTDVVGGLPGFGAVKNKAVTDAMGLENVPLDAARRSRLADVLDAIGWALGS